MKFGNYAKTQGMLVAQVINCLTLMMQYIAIFASKFTDLKKKTECVCQISSTNEIVANY